MSNMDNISANCGYDDFESYAMYCNDEAFIHKNKQRKPSGRGNCPVCGAATHKVSGKFGEFYGCDNFPKCKGNRNS